MLILRPIERTDLDDLVGEEGAQRVDVGCAALNQVTALRGVEVGGGEVLKVVVDSVADASDNVLARRGGPAPAQVGKTACQSREPDEDEARQP